MSGSLIRPFFAPLLLVGVLAALLGFFVTRSLQGDPAQRAAKVSVVGIPATAAPTVSGTPSPSPSSVSEGTRRGSGRKRDPRCPSGCECQFPPHGAVVICHGSRPVTIP